MIDAVARKRGEIFFALAKLDPPPTPTTITELVGVVPFTFTTGTLVLGAVQPSYRFNRAAVLIDTPFTDSSATIQFGTSADPGFILGGGDIKPTEEGQYESDALVVIQTSDVLLLTVSPGTSTQGSGLLLYKVTPP